MCSLSIAPRQMCARGRGHNHFELWPVGRPGAAEEEGREGWRWMTRTVEEGVGGWTCLFSFTLCPLSPSQHTHTHTRTHILILLGHHQGTHLHCNYITLFFLPFFFEIKKKLDNYLFYLFICLFTCLFICSFVHLFTCLFTNLFICLFTRKMSFLPPGILHRFLCLHNYVKKKAFFFFFFF